MSCFSRDKGGFVTPPQQQSGSSSFPVITVDQCLTNYMRQTDGIEYQEGPRDILPSDPIAIEDAIEDFPEPIADVAWGWLGLENKPREPDAAPEPNKAPDDDGLTPSQRSTPDPGPCCSETIKRSRWARFFTCGQPPPEMSPPPPASPYRRRDTSLKMREALCKLNKKRRAVSADPTAASVAAAAAASTSDEVTVFRMDPLSEQCMSGSEQRWLDFDHAGRERAHILGTPMDDAEDMLYVHECLGVDKPHITRALHSSWRAAASAIIPGQAQRLLESAASAACSPYEPMAAMVIPVIRVDEPTNDAAVQAVAETKQREAQTVPDFTNLDNLKDVLEKLPVRPCIRRRTNKKVDIVHFTELYSPPPEFADEEASGRSSDSTGDRYHITFEQPGPNFDPGDYNDSNFTYTIYGDIDEDAEKDDANKEFSFPMHVRRREYLI